MDRDILVVTNPHNCGIGLEERCCAYLTVGSLGFECERESSLGHVLARRAEAGEMHARRLPTDPHAFVPGETRWECQLSDKEIGR